jgi:hypothetical protein
MRKKHTYAQLQDCILESLLYVEKFKKDEFSTNFGLAASTLSLTRNELKPIYQKFKNNFKLSDAELKAKGDAIGAEFDAAIAEDPIEVMAVLSRFAGGDL